ncbi:MAG: hypothetical protein IPO09_17560 [Anaeromyxobacter sp.]|nr:hypothetical protein [Anaeromyxobacter sp.]MBL0276493.1 hypothetical protein [Anaeromyxobacter sp.]
MVHVGHDQTRQPHPFVDLDCVDFARVGEEDVDLLHRQAEVLAEVRSAVARPVTFDGLGDVGNREFIAGLIVAAAIPWSGAGCAAHHDRQEDAGTPAGHADLVTAHLISSTIQMIPMESPA